MRVSLRNIRADRNVRATGRRVGMDITWLDNRIAVGGGIWKAENMAAVSRAGITHIINMQVEFPDDTLLAKPHGIVVCWNPVDDDFESKPPEVFERGVEFALKALQQHGAKLFIHCAAGVHRAPMMALALLAEMGRARGQTVEQAMEDAINLIEGKRSAADFAEVYVQSVERFLEGRVEGTSRQEAGKA
jgi:protein-tyrosine phosphatase